MVMEGNRGFTLIELMVVIAVIGILGAIAIPQLSAYRNRAYLAALQNDAHAIANAQTAYYLDCGTYTSTTHSLLAQTYGVNLSKNTVIQSWQGDTVSFSFKLIDPTHGNVSLVYRSTLGGIH